MTTLHDEMRRLWTDHVVWTRQFIVSTLAGLPDAPAALARLMHNQDEIGAVFARCFGMPTGQAVARLLREHIRLAGVVVDEARRGDPKRLGGAQIGWRANAAEIANALGPLLNISTQALYTMLLQHLDLTTREVTLRIQRRWPDDVVNFDEILRQALMMADALTAGIEAASARGACRR